MITINSYGRVLIFNFVSYAGFEASGVNAESVEPILTSFGSIANETQRLMYMPFILFLLIQYRNQIGLPVLYGIKQSDMIIYLTYQAVMVFFRPMCDIFMMSQLELFHGWKVYEYLVYSRYRFLQREQRWKGMETSLDECIDERLRRIDQMCFSSQYYTMLTVQTNGIVFIVFGFETWFRTGYYPFSDTGLPMLTLFMVIEPLSFIVLMIMCT